MYRLFEYMKSQSEAPTVDMLLVAKGKLGIESLKLGVDLLGATNTIQAGFSRQEERILVRYTIQI
jgi:hypothetical protein